MAKRIALTFKGNPYSPITEFEKWYWEVDRQKAEMCCSALARRVNFSSETPLSEQDSAREDAINELVEENFTGYFEKYEED